jgi:crotonobetainyl-CoA:carnitine CoA-transferase CaiB-like acyl-CoA transferase
MRPFEGIKILDCTHVLAGPFTAYQLAVTTEAWAVHAAGRNEEATTQMGRFQRVATRP